MDFEDAKENIQPLAAGRNASILLAALHAESHHELQQQRREYEDAIQNYVGEDPLEPWFEYIYWIEQSFPSGGKESGLEEVLLKCLTKFEKDERYHQDRRMIKLYIKYIDTHENPQECYQQLYNQGIGTMVADLYICWAYYYDLCGNFRKADQIFRRGIDCRAQPIEELQEAHQHFGFTMSQRILYNDDSSKQKYQSNLEEKRHALTSLKSHRKKVGSLRTGAAVKSFAPGKVQVAAGTSSRSSNIDLRVFEDENQDPNAISSPEKVLESSKSVVKTILDSARKQENVKEPGPWNKAHDKKKGNLFDSEPRTELGFQILEDDEELQPIKGKINYGKPFIFFEGFIARNKPQEEWILPVTLENELMPRSYPSYDKCLLYPQPNMEYSLEELGCYYWCKRRNIQNNFTKRYDQIWAPNINSGLRMYPNFAKKNIPFPEEESQKERGFDPLEINSSGKSKLVFDPRLCYPTAEDELQFEEVMYQRWKNGERKLKNCGNETIAMTEEMEETICVPHEGARRKSFFPTRNTIAPSLFSKFSTKESEEEDKSTVEQALSRRSVIMKTPKKNSREKSPEPSTSFAASTRPQKLSFQIYEEEPIGQQPSVPQVFSAEEIMPKTPFLQKVRAVSIPESDKVSEPKVPFEVFEDEGKDVAFEFKAPAAPTAKAQKLQFQIYEEEENTYEANETCSTQMFNCFIKAQSVSTPKAPNKVMKPSNVDRQQTNLNFSGIENVPLPTTSATTTVTFSSPEYNEAGLTLHGKQLSTIMETSEQVTGNTASIKSSGSTPDFEVEAPPAKVPLTNNVCTLETVQEAGSLAEKECAEVFLMQSLKLVEDTPTVRQHNEISRLEQREDTVPTMPNIKIFEDKTETVPKIMFAKAGNFSRLEDREDTAPRIRPVKFQEDKTETITKMVLPSGKNVSKSISPDAEMLELFAKSPERGTAKRGPTCASSVPNKSIFSASAFMNFQDSPDAKVKCNYDSPELRAKQSSIECGKKFTNLSFLPNFDEVMENDGSENNKVLQTSFLPNLSIATSSQKQQTPRDNSLGKGLLGRSFQQHQQQSDVKKAAFEEPQQNKPSKEESFMLGFQKTTDSNIPPREQKSIEDSFLLEFQNTTFGSVKPKASGLVGNGSSMFKQPGDLSFMKNTSNVHFEKKHGKTEEEPLKDQKSASDSFMKFSFFTDGKPSALKESSLMKSFRADNSFLPSLSTSIASQGRKANSILPDVSSKRQAKEQCGEESFANSCSMNLSTAPTVQKKVNLSECFDVNKSSVEGKGVQAEKDPSNSRNEAMVRSSHITGNQQIPQIDSFKQPKGMSFSPQANEIRPVKQVHQSMSSSTLGFLNTTNHQKQNEQEQKFTIFEDSVCQKAQTVPQAKATNSFMIFEDSVSKTKVNTPPANKNVCFDVSSKSDEFFEDNIRTEAFATNLSMIRNSTWLPNHDPRQAQRKMETSREEFNVSSPLTSENRSAGLSIFSNVPSQQNSIKLMPPPSTVLPPKNSNKNNHAQISNPSSNDCIEITESDDDDSANLGKSIYYTKTPKTPKLMRHTWSPELDQQTPECNVFIHKNVDLDHTQHVIDNYCVSEDVNPFSRELISAFLYQIDFTNYIEKLSTCNMVGRVKPLKKDSSISISGKTFNILKLVGEGSYGAVFCAKELQSGKLFALKQERPANLWEYYICLELRSRLNSAEILSGFMTVDYALVGNNAGVLVSNFSKYGSLITVCNIIKKETLRNVDEYVVMHMASQLLLIIDHLHASNIIHADIKPDNFLLMEKLVPGRRQPTIQLIDFGNSIDMDLFKKGQTFRFTHQIESFKCVEMREQRPWTYQLDLFGLAGVIHVLLFGKYMEIVKKPSGWTHKSHVPRYFNKALWEIIFHSLLNVDDCQTMPNLQDLRAQLEEEMAEKDKAVFQKIAEFNRALDASSVSK